LLHTCSVHTKRRFSMLLSSFKKMFVGLSLLACSSVFAAPLTVDVTGILSNGEMGDADNTVLTFNVGANAKITSIGYDFNLTAYDPSWLSEIGLAFTDSSGLLGVVFNPGVGVMDSGTESYADYADLTALGLDFQVGADGLLRLEFYEDFDDIVGADGIWNFGTITFGVENEAEVPEPASALLLAGGAALAVCAISASPRQA
jgi:hypothetical protein